MPTTAFDTFFACTILVAAALIATAFFASNMQLRIENTQDLNKNSYLTGIADNIVASPGAPLSWGTSGSTPEQFGLAQAQSNLPNELDPDKVSRLNSQNNAFLTQSKISDAAKLDNIAFGINISPLLALGIEQTANQSVGSNTLFEFTVSAVANSKPTDTALRAFVIANNYCSDLIQSMPNGFCTLNVEVPTADVENGLLIVFGRAAFDERATAYAIYSFSEGRAQSIPQSNIVSLSTLDYNLTVNTKTPGSTVEKSYLLSYSYQTNITAKEDVTCPFPRWIDKSPFVIVVSGSCNGQSFVEWTAYPQVPLTAGSNFEGTERNVYTYIVTIKGSLYKLELSLGGLPS